MKSKGNGMLSKSTLGVMENRLLLTLKLPAEGENDCISFLWAESKFKYAVTPFSTESPFKLRSVDAANVSAGRSVMAAVEMVRPIAGAVRLPKYGTAETSTPVA